MDKTCSSPAESSATDRGRTKKHPRMRWTVRKQEVLCGSCLEKVNKAEAVRHIYQVATYRCKIKSASLTQGSDCAICPSPRKGRPNVKKVKKPSAQSIPERPVPLIHGLIDGEQLICEETRTVWHPQMCAIDIRYYIAKFTTKTAHTIIVSY